MHFTKNQAFFPLRSTRLELGFFHYFLLQRDLAEARARNGTLCLDQLRAATTSRSNHGPRICTIRFRLSPGNHPETTQSDPGTQNPAPSHTTTGKYTSRRFLPLQGYLGGRKAWVIHCMGQIFSPRSYFCAAGFWATVILGRSHDRVVVT